MPRSSALHALEPQSRQADLFVRRPRKAPPASEFSVHCMVADALDRWLRRDWRFTHIPSGELREKQTAARLKRMGVKPGWSDFVLLPPTGRAHFLELKRRGETLSESQTEFAAFCYDHGIPFACCHSFDDAVKTLTGWGALRVSLSL